MTDQRTATDRYIVLDESTAVGKFTEMLDAANIGFDILFIQDTIKISYVVSGTCCEFFFSRATGNLVAVGAMDAELTRKNGI